MKYLKKYQQHTQYEEVPINTTIHTVSHCKEDLHVHYDLKSESYNYLRFKALEDSTFQFTNAIEYSLDGNEWVELEANTDTPIVEKGRIILWRGNITPNSTNGIGTFSSSGKYEAKGNPLSLRLGDNFKGVTTMPNNSYMFYKLFYANTGLISAKDLSLVCTTIRPYCYNRMFYGCKNLVNVCNLPATTLRDGAYAYMFFGCSSLTKAPYISADYTMGTTIAEGSCLGHMFYGCTSMTSIDKIPSNNTSTKYSYAYYFMFMNCSSLASIPSVTIDLSKGNDACSMFRNCTSLVDASPIIFTGTTIAYKSCENMFNGCTSLTTPPSGKIPSVITFNYCCSNMFNGCIALTTAPALMASSMKPYSYENMFNGCISLKHPPIMASSITMNANNCFASMFRGCTSLEETIETTLLSGSTSSCQDMFRGCIALTRCNITFTESNKGEACFASMFNGCTSLISAPELPATSLSNSCYNYMFYGCTSLVNVPSILPATTLPHSCYRNMFQGCTNITTAPELPALSLYTGCYIQMFDGCSKLNYIKALYTTAYNTNYTSDWVRGVAKNGKFILNPSQKSRTRGASGIPNGWTIEDAVIE